MAKSSSMSPAIHNISFCGLTGVIFAIIAVAMVLYMEAFVTTSWVVNSNSSTYVGLWHTYTYAGEPHITPGWFLTVQIFVCLGLLGVIVCFILATLYMSANKASKNLTLVALVFVSFLTAGLAFIGLIVFGAFKTDESGSFSWSFAVTFFATLLLLFAGLLTIVKIRRSNVRLC